MSELAKALGPMARRIGNLLSRGVVGFVDSARKMQSLQVNLLAGESKDDIEHFEPYGFTSCPKPGAETIAAFFDGDRSTGVVLVVADRRFRLTGLAAGEVAIHDDQGQKVHLTRAGIVIEGAGLPIKITDTPTVTIEASTSIVLDTPLVDVRHQLLVREGITGQGGGSFFGGDLEVTGGDVLVSGGDVKADAISLKNHRTSLVVPGTGTGGAPVV